MNYIQFSLFLCYLIAIFLAGAGLYSILNNSEIRLNKIICIGESLLLGSIFLVGQLFILSFIHLYKNPYLWAVVFLNYLFILRGSTRKFIKELFNTKFRASFTVVIFGILLGILVFRNIYYLIDVDSLSTYLFTQKLWVESGTSFIGNAASDVRIFTVQFDAIPYSLGISLFGQETLFPQLVNLLWRLIVLLLVFGYTKYRLNGYYALAASMFIIFNDHFFYSGANQWVIINAAVIALLFAAVYNFWEARVKNNVSYLVFALVFIIQLMANKYYLLFTFISLTIFGILIQPEPMKCIKELVRNKRYVVAVLISFFFMSLWYIKNFMVTGDPAFPLLAGRLHVFGWTQEQQRVFSQLIGGLSPLKLMKYISFLFIWPGVTPAKYVLISIFILPFLFLFCITKKKVKWDEVAELCFWIGICILSFFSLCIVTWQDPRIYRFLIGLFSFTAVLALRFIIINSLNLKNEIIAICLVLLFSLQGYSIVYRGGVIINVPSIKENIDIALNRLHMDYVIKKHHPEVFIILKGLEENKDRINSSAWFLPVNTNAFLLPDRPNISLLCTTVIKWDSYSHEDLIVKDLENLGIKWIMTLKNNKLEFISIREFSHEAMQFERFPKKTLYDYGFPDELTRIN